MSSRKSGLSSVEELQRLKLVRTFNDGAIQCIAANLSHLDHPSAVYRLVQMDDDGTARTAHVRKINRAVAEAIVLLLHENGYDVVKRGTPQIEAASEPQNAQ